MSRQLPAEGDYRAICTGPLKVIQEKTGTIGIAVPFKLTNSDVPWSNTHVVYITKVDGTILLANIDNLKKVFGWDGSDPWWLEREIPEDANSAPRDFSTTEFMLNECVYDDFTTPEGKTIQTFKPSWLNPIGGKGREFVAADRSTFLKQFGAKLRASAGGKPASKPATPSKPTRTKQKAVVPSTMEEAWGLLHKKNPGKSEAQLSSIYFAKITELFPDIPETEQEKLTPAQYGELKAAFEA